MTLFLCIATMTPALVQEAVRYAVENTIGEIGVILHMNGIPFERSMLECVPSTWRISVTTSDKNIGVTEAYHAIYERHRDVGAATDLLLYIHDDVHILERGWDSRLEVFLREHPKAGLVGFGGARGLGDPDLYRKPYVLTQLARRQFMSNMRDAEAHGARIDQPQRVATLDGFSLGCRRGFLDQLGGYNWWPYPHHSYDNGLACEAARHGWETWVLPIACHHHGGLTATRPAYTEGLAATFGGDGEIHRLGHILLYERYRDVLPLWVEK